MARTFGAGPASGPAAGGEKNAPDEYWSSLISESFVIFQDFSERKRAGFGAEQNPTLMAVNTSMQYRSVLQSCIARIQEALTTADGEEAQRLTLTLSEFAEMDLLWHLCDIFFLRSPILLNTGKGVLNDIFDWVDEHLPVLPPPEPTDEDDRFWFPFFQFLFVGKFAEAADLLRAAPSWPQAPAAHEALLVLLQRAPLLDGSADVLRGWQRECNSVLATTLTRDSPLRHACQLLGGDPDAIMTLRPYAQCWYQLLAALLGYTAPQTSVLDVEPLCRRALDAFQPGAGARPTSELDKLLLDIVAEQNADSILFEVSDFFDRRAFIQPVWFAAHLVDLLAAADWLSDDAHEFHKKIMSSYATYLDEICYEWPIACAYEFTCVNGLKLVEDRLGRVHPATDRVARKLLFHCRSYGLDHIATSVCRERSLQLARQNRHVPALHWLLQTPDSAEEVAALADAFLSHCQAVNAFQQLQGVSDLGTAARDHPRLLFLADYFDFRAALQDETRQAEAARKLVTMLTTAHATPAWFMLSLLTDAVPLLEHPQLSLGRTETETVLGKLATHCLLDDTAARDPSLVVVRTALHRNLLRTYIQRS